MEKAEGNEQERFAIARELWFREDEKELIERKEIIATIRAGDRTAETSDPKGGYREGRFITLKIQKEGGGFDPLETVAVPRSVQKKRLGDIEPSDLAGTSLVAKTKSELIEKLKRLYGKEFTDDDMVTIVRFEYKDNLKETNDLVRTKTLSFAHEPKDNPENLDFSSYTVPLVEHDYPAKTPVMWNAAYREFGIDAGNIMLVGNPKQCGHMLDVFRRDTKYKGGGAGVGFKDEVIPYLDEVEPLACKMGAVNFILKTGEGKLKGFNTDGSGYIKSLEDIFRKKEERLSGKKAVVLGAGGSSNAVVFMLAEKGMRVVILNRTVKNARDLAEKINQHFQKSAGETVRFGGEDKIMEEVKDADVVINVSRKGEKGVLEQYSALATAKLPATAENILKNRQMAEEILKLIPPHAILSDIVLRKEGLTPMLETAQGADFEILDGNPMVINQGVEAFWLLYSKELQAKNVTKEQVAEVMKQAASASSGQAASF